MLDALRAALRVYGDRDRWRAIQVEGMRRDFSWNASAKAYVREYQALIHRTEHAAGETEHA